MTYLINSPETFVGEALDGFVAANQRYVRRVDGGIVRSADVPEHQVAVVIGGGSGHYPAFAGLVGPGMAAASVCGNIFASPSAGQAYRVAATSHRGGGVLFCYGNYAGDNMHFGEAERRLREEEIDVRTVVVTDDVASAHSASKHKRRGIAGDFVVFKVAGAAAESGLNLNEVERVARKANENTSSIGIAFEGCTLPGADGKLFTVPPGMMSLGLGIHGEPGIRELSLGSANEIADLLVQSLLAERPASVTTLAGQRITAIVNGLGTVKYEELFVLYGKIDALLSAQGIVVVEPECGEFVTSLDMAGVSLTITWLDKELEDLWSAPADTPAYRKGAVTPVSHADAAALPEERFSGNGIDAGRQIHEGPALVAAGEPLVVFLRAANQAVIDNEAELGRIDALAGDGDHGVGMVRGLGAALAAAERSVAAGKGAAAALQMAGDAWSENAGGTSGALWGGAFENAGRLLGQHDDVSSALVGRAVEEACAAMQRMGNAEPGDKTMIDAFRPFVDTLNEEIVGGSSLKDAWQTAAVAADAAARATAQLRPKLGRARPLAEKSLGHPDAGATSFALMVQAVASAANHDERTSR